MKRDNITIQSTQRGNFLKLRIYSDTHSINLSEVTHIESERDYVAIHYFRKDIPSAEGKKRFIILGSLKGLAPQLEHHGFIQTHRSYLVNMIYIAGIEKNPTAYYNVILHIPHQEKPLTIPIGRGRYKESREIIQDILTKKHPRS